MLLFLVDVMNTLYFSFHYYFYSDKHSQERVRIMRRRQLLYNGQGLRHDGCLWLAKIIAPRHQYLVILAFCGVDGSLLDVPQPRPSESWADISAVLEPLLQELLEVRLEGGYSVAEAAPVFHATDVFHKHEYCLQRLYARVFSAMRLSSVADTPKGPARRRRVMPAEHLDSVCAPTGEPFHDIIN